jgi:sensor domain CHASE-containing protein
MGDDSSIMRAVVTGTVSVVVISLHVSPQLKRVVEPQIENHIEDAFVNSTAEPLETLNPNRSMIR